MKKVCVCLFLLLLAASGRAFEVNVAKDLGPVSFVRWPVSAIPIPYVIDANGSVDAGFNDTATSINNAFAAWQNVTKQTIRFSFSGTSPAAVNCSDRVNSILWIEKNWPNSSFILAVTRTTFLLQDPPDLIDADISFNGDDFRWSREGASGTVSIQAVAQHEIGHMLGLQHTQIRGAVMLPAASNIQKLSKDDRAAIRFLYPSSTSSKFAILSPPKRATLFDSSSSLPLATFRWTVPDAFTNFLVQFSSSSDFKPAATVRSIATGSAAFLQETGSLRKQLKKLGGTKKKVFWRVRADTPVGQETTRTSLFLFE